MRRQRSLAISAGLAFALSFFLPALGTSSGLSCLRECWGILTRSNGYDNLGLGGWLYFSGFVAANALFVVLLSAIFLSAQGARLRLWASIAATLQVLSLFIMHLAYAGTEGKFDLGVGYFVWLLSFVLLVCAHVVLRNRPGSSPGPAPAPATPEAGRLPPSL